jgi:hypothetical protein
MFKVVRKVKRWLSHRMAGSKKPWLDQLSAQGKPSAEQVFTHIYANNVWGDAESASGVGSNLEQTRLLREKLPALLHELGVQRMLDIPCGDFHWLGRVELGVASYLGADIVAPLVAANQAKYGRDEAGKSIAFAALNLLADPLPCVDLVLCRDCLVHLSNADVRQALAQIKRSGSTYLLTTTYPTRANDKDIRTGEWRPLNLQAAPFALPPPTLAILEGCTERNGRFPDKTLALWRTADLPG